MDTIKTAFARSSVPYLLLLAMAMAMAIAGLWLRASSGQTYFFTNDSFGYIDEARNLLGGLGVTRTNLEFAHPEEAFRPTSLFPPGYPILIAAATSVVGIDPTTTALWISRAAWILLPLALVWSTRRMLGTTAASALALVVATSPGVVQWGSRAMTDVPALLMTVLAFGAFIRGLNSPKHRWFLASGLIAGLGVCLRNASIATPAAMSLAIVAAFPLRILPPKPALRAALIFWLGAAPPMAALWLRNLLVFGTIQPYAQGMPVRELTVANLWVAFREHLWELFLDLTGSETVAMFAWQGEVLLLVLFPLAVLVAWKLIRRWQAQDDVWRVFTVLLAGYSVVVVAMIVYANARFGTYHEYRFPMQYSWCVIALVLGAFSGYPELPDTILKRLALALGTAVLLAAHGMFLHGQLEREALIRDKWDRDGLVNGTQSVARQGWRRPGNLVALQFRLRLSRDNELLNTIRELPRHAFVIVTDGYGGLLHFESGRAVHSLMSLRDPPPPETRLLEVVASLGARRPVYYLFVPDFMFLLKSDSEVWQEVARPLLPKGFAVVRESSNFVLAVYDGER